MIMDKEWMVKYGEKQMAQLVELLKSEMEEPNPTKRDPVTLLRLHDAIHFTDTILCVMQVLPETFDTDLKNLYNKAREEKEGRDSPDVEVEKELNV